MTQNTQANIQSKNNKIASIEERILQLQNQKKQEIQKQKASERKARTRRLCQRHGLIESMMPELISITDDQFKAFLEKAVYNAYGRDILRKILSQPPPITSQSEPSANEMTKSKSSDDKTGRNSVSNQNNIAKRASEAAGS